MRLRVFGGSFAFVLLCAISICAVGCGGGGGSTPPVMDTVSPSVTAISAPDLPTADGGNTTISAVATDNIGVARIYAIVAKPGGLSESIAMTLVSGSSYTCTFAAPLNLDDTDDIYQVMVSAYDAAGNIGSAGPVSFKVPGSGPPPPPPPPAL
jgi:hypothetical protein